MSNLNLNDKIIRYAYYEKPDLNVGDIKQVYLGRGIAVDGIVQSIRYRENIKCWIVEVKIPRNNKRYPVIE